MTGNEHRPKRVAHIAPARNADVAERPDRIWHAAGAHGNAGGTQRPREDQEIGKEAFRHTIGGIAMARALASFTSAARRSPRNDSMSS